VTIGGTGDAYLVCALSAAFAAHHGCRSVEVVGKSRHRAIANLFAGVRWASDDALIAHVEGDTAFHAAHDNAFLSGSAPFFVHPCFLRSGARIDKLTMVESPSQADMYRALLRLPPDAPLSTPSRLPAVQQVPGTVLLIPEAISWPNTQPAFWSALAEALRRRGRRVTFNDPDWALDEVFRRAAASEWVIGPQCGLMSILVTGRFPCRKSLCSPRLSDANKKHVLLSPRTFPYAYVTKFAGEDHDVDEFEVRDDNHEEIVAAVANGPNALRVSPVHDPRPVLTVQTPLSPGDFLDRLAVLDVKRRRFRGVNRASIEREYRRFLHIFATAGLPPAAIAVYPQMVELHDRTFTLLERLVPAALNGGGRPADHDAAIALNRDRIKLKRIVDDLCRGPYTEIKSYHGVGG